MSVCSEIGRLHVLNMHIFVGTGGHAEIVRMLIEGGADVNQKVPALVTPLHNAAIGMLG